MGLAIEARILAALADGPVPAWRIAEALGVPVGRVCPLLADLRKRGLVVCEPDANGVRVWRRRT